MKIIYPTEITPDILSVDTASGLEYQTWASGIEYFEGDIVIYSGRNYQCLEVTSSTPALTWSSSTTYSVGNVVAYNNSLYTALKTTTNEIPSNTPLSWSETGDVIWQDLGPTAAAWNRATTYTEGQKVLFQNRVYEALKTTTNERPDRFSLSWLDLGANNRWRMFDDKVGSYTESSNAVIIEMTPGIINAVSLLNIANVKTITVRLTDGIDGEVYNKTVRLYSPENVGDWWSYFFEDIIVKTSVFSLDLPTYRSATLRVVITPVDGKALKVGTFVTGKLFKYAPAVNYGASIGIQDYSRKDRDEFGNITVVERAFNKRARWNFMLKNSEIDVFQQRMAKMRATPCLYIGADGYESMAIYGFYKDFDTVISYPTTSECSIEVEGLT